MTSILRTNTRYWNDLHNGFTIILCFPIRWCLTWYRFLIWSFIWILFLIRNKWWTVISKRIFLDWWKSWVRIKWSFYRYAFSYFLRFWSLLCTVTRYFIHMIYTLWSIWHKLKNRDDVRWYRNCSMMIIRLIDRIIILCMCLHTWFTYFLYNWLWSLVS